MTAGHQLQNAKYLSDHQAAVILNESDLLEDPNRLARLARDLLNDGPKLKMLSHNLSSFAKPNARKDLADLILNSKNEK